MASCFLPFHTDRLVFQGVEDTDPHRLLPKFALAENEVLTVRVHGGYVNFIMGIPPAPYFGKLERPRFRSVEFPHPFPAHVLIDIGGVVGDKSLMDLSITIRLFPLSMKLRFG